MKAHLWKGQCSCPYWHGVFGGLYLPHLREANYNNLIRAEVMASEALRESVPRLLKIDFNQDGEEEILAETQDLNLYLKPSLGGGIFELDYKPKAINLHNILSRRPEAYHQKIVARSCGGGSGHESIHQIEKRADFDPAKVLVYDQYQRLSFLVRFMSVFNEGLIKNGQKGEAGEILAGPYTMKTENKKGGIIISLEKVASLGPSRINMLKRVYLKREGGAAEHNRFAGVSKGGGAIEYEIELAVLEPSTQRGCEAGLQNFKGLLGLEFCLSILEAESTGSSQEKDRFSIKDKHRDLTVSFISRPEARWWKGALETVSQSETSYELTPQGVIIFPYWELDLKPGEKINFYLKEQIS
jgi:alpha-amylase